MTGSKAAERITEECLEGINGSMLGAIMAFNELETKAPDLHTRRQVLDTLEEKMIARASHIGDAWRKNICPQNDRYGEKVRSVALSLGVIGTMQDDRAQTFTRLFSDEYSVLCRHRQETARNLAACFAGVSARIEEAARLALEIHCTSITRQQALNRAAARYKATIV